MKTETIAGMAALMALACALAADAPSGGIEVRLPKPLAAGTLRHACEMRRFEVPLKEPWDLSSAAGVAFWMKCEDPDAITGTWLYFRTGDGYYRTRVEKPSAPGEWTRCIALRSKVRLYHWNTHVSLHELHAEPNPADLPDWRRVTGFQIVFSLAVDHASADASVRVRDFSPVSSGSPECAAALKRADAAEKAAIERTKAFAPRGGERRYLSTHVWGLDGDWDKTCRMLKGYGITDIIPLMAYDGKAYYNSRIEPPAPIVAKRGDALKACLAACRKHGIRCIPWRSCWELYTVDSEKELNRLEAEGRLQVSFAGKRGNWFCPTHPGNVQREIDGMMELAEAGADGLLLDYFRYPGVDYCFCPRCRGRFEESIGRKIDDWPQAVRKDPALAKAWSQFRMGVLTDILRRARAEMKRKTPDILFASATAATLGGAEARGQDLPRWCKEGLFDMLFTMCYCTTHKMLANDVKNEMEFMRGSKTVLCPMICFASGAIPFNDPDEIARQIQVVRDAGLPDLSFFRLEEYTPMALDALRQGPLAPVPGK